MTDDRAINHRHAGHVTPPYACTCGWGLAGYSGTTEERYAQALAAARHPSKTNPA